MAPITKEQVEVTATVVGTAATLYGLGVAIRGPFKEWRQKRRERKAYVPKMLDALCAGQTSLASQIEATNHRLGEMDRKREEVTVVNERVHLEIQADIKELSKDTRMSVSASVAAIDALLQHDKEINGNVKLLHSKLQNRIIEGIGK